SWGWTGGYGLFALLTIACAVAVWRSQHGKGRHVMVEPIQDAPEDLNAGPGPATRVRWIALAFVPSSMMLGVTTHITLDIAAIPLIWVIPLALYLLSFILVFANWPAPQNKFLRVLIQFIPGCGRWPLAMHKTMTLVMPLL